MHDLDHILTESDSYDEFDDDKSYETQNDFMDDDYEGVEIDDYEWDDDEFDADEFDDDESVLSAGDEIDLASELLDADDDEQLDQVFDEVAHRVVEGDVDDERGRRGRRRRRRQARRARRRRVAGRARRLLDRLKPVLKNVAKKALPAAGAAAGGYFGGPAGANAGLRAGSAAGQMFELDLDGLSVEDQQMEVAREVVRFAADAMSNVADNADGDAAPEQVVRDAVIDAAARHAPGLLRERGDDSVAGGNRAQRGRWVRRGNKIILIGV